MLATPCPAQSACVLAAALLLALTGCPGGEDGGAPPSGGRDLAGGGRDLGGGDGGTTDSGPRTDRGLTDGALDGEPEGGLDAPADAGDDEPDLEDTCDSVCFEWTAPTETPTPTPVDEVVYEDCNQFGSEPGVCPSGFSCGERFRYEFSSVVYDLPACRTSAGSPFRVDLDVPEPFDPANPVDVTLHFVLNGAAWPTSLFDGDAGQLTLIGRDGQGTLTADIPESAPGEITVPLDPGVYWLQASLPATSIDTRTYPSTFRRGTLVVLEGGSIEVPLLGSRVDYQILLDGTPLGPLEEDEFVTVWFQGHHSQQHVRHYGAGEVTAAEVVLEPDVYDVSIITTGPYGGGGRLPNGQVPVLEALEISGEPNLTLPLTTVDVSGSVRVNGAELPAGGSSGTVVFHDPSGRSNRFAVSAERPATYSGRVYDGTYDVVYDATSTYLPGVPWMPGLALEQVTAGANLNLDLTAVRIQGHLTLDGGEVPDSSGNRGTFWFESSWGSETVSLFDEGPAEYDFWIFDGVYDISISGDGELLPEVRWPLAVDYRSSPTTRSFNIDAHWLTVTATHNGVQPPDGAAADFRPRGDLVLTALDAPIGVRSSAVAWSQDWPTAGAMTTRVLLPTGRWSLAYGNRSGSYAHMPSGRAELGELQIASDISRSYDVRSVEVIGDVTQAGAPFPAAMGGLTRGHVTIHSIEQGTVAVVDGTGAASYRLRVYPGLVNVTWHCSESSDCDPRFAWGNSWSYWGVVLP